MAREVTLVDAGLGNLASVERALVQVGAGVRVTDDPDRVATSRMVVFPGQSAFGAATTAIVEGAMGAALKMVIERGDPFLGICLGMQLLFDGSDENGGQEGLHVMPGWCRRFPEAMFEEAEEGATERDNEPAEALSEEAPPPQSVSTDVEPHGAFASVPFDAEDSPPSPFDAEPEPAPRAVGAEDSLPRSIVVPPIEAVAATSLVAPLIAPSIPPPPPEAETGPATPLQRHLKVPHMGWNSVEPTNEHYYFVHSFYVEPKRAEDVMWMTTY